MGMQHDELRYILDPRDVYGPDFPGETFRVLKEKEIKQYEKYRTRKLVLEAWDRLGLAPRNRDGQHEIEPRSAVLSLPRGEGEAARAQGSNGIAKPQSGSVGRTPVIRVDAPALAGVMRPVQAGLPGVAGGPVKQALPEPPAPRPAARDTAALRRLVLERCIQTLATAGPLPARELAKRLVPLDSRIDRSLINSVLYRESGDRVRQDGAGGPFRLRSGRSS
jgi:hypothetical protein